MVYLTLLVKLSFMYDKYVQVKRPAHRPCSGQGLPGSPHDSPLISNSTWIIHDMDLSSDGHAKNVSHLYSEVFHQIYM